MASIYFLNKKYPNLFPEIRNPVKTFSSAYFKYHVELFLLRTETIFWTHLLAVPYILYTQPDDHQVDKIGDFLSDVCIHMADRVLPIICFGRVVKSICDGIL